MPSAPEVIDAVGGWLYRHRGVTAVPPALFAVWAARPTPTSFALGLLLVVAGESLRVAALRHAGAHTRGRTLRAPHLVTSGPYARLRHPLYAGNALACAGLLVASRAGAPWFPALFAALFAAQYAFFMRREESFLADAWPREWPAYAARVPFVGWARQAASATSPRTSLSLGEALRLEFSTLRTAFILLLLIGLRPWWPPSPGIELKFRRLLGLV